MINIVLFKPDIPQNTAAILRIGACFGLKIHLIEPCGFNLNDKRFRRVVMDYINLTKIQNTFYIKLILTMNFFMIMN